MQSEGSSYPPPQSQQQQYQRSQFYTPSLDQRDSQRPMEAASSMTNIHYGEYDRMGNAMNTSPRNNLSARLRSTSCCNNTSSYSSRFVGLL